MASVWNLWVWLPCVGVVSTLIIPTTIVYRRIRSRNGEFFFFRAART